MEIGMKRSTTEETPISTPFSSDSSTESLEVFGNDSEDFDRKGSVGLGDGEGVEAGLIVSIDEPILSLSGE